MAEKTVDSGMNGTAKTGAGAAGKMRPMLVIAITAAAAAVAGSATVAIPAGHPTAAPAYAAAHSKEAPAAEPKVLDPVIFDVDRISVNLSGNGGRSFLVTTIALELRSKTVLDALNSKLKTAQLKDLLISILSAKSTADIDGKEKKDDLRRELRDELNIKLGLDSGIARVYFTEFNFGQSQ